MKYAEDLTIDKNSLDNEWIKQPYLYMQYAEAYAQADYEKQKIKEKMDIIKAQADKRAREQIIIEGDRITESKVSSLILLDEEYRNACTNFNEKSLETAVIGAAVKAMEHKKKSLEKL